MGPVQEFADGRSSARLLTVGIPVFNGRQLFRDCLQSVVDSGLARDRFEIVVADDGSSEPETLAILDDFAERLATAPGFFRVIRSDTNSGGAARPRNAILDEAVGEYVFFVDSDDTIGDQALERIAEAVQRHPADWVAVHQVPVNGRSAVCTVRKPYAEVSRIRALKTLTVHKVFRRAEVERQQLRFDEGLPSGQDVTFAFRFLLDANAFLMLGGYDFYYLTRHTGDSREPAHLSMRARSPQARFAKNERMLGSMIAALQTSEVPAPERREIVGQVILPRVLVVQKHLEAIVDAGPESGGRALRRLAEILQAPVVGDLESLEVHGLTEAHLSVIAGSDWPGLARLVRRPSLRERVGGSPWGGRLRRLVTRLGVPTRAGPRGGRS